jgi:hypothetical protein
LATQSDAIAVFVADPVESAKHVEEPFMMVNKTLHTVFGYDAKPAELVEIVRRGPLGIEAVCSWMDSCIQNLEIGEGMFEPRIERLLAAMSTM